MTDDIKRYINCSSRVCWLQ